MDGRVQLPVITYLQNRFDVPYIDSITEPAPNHILSEDPDSNAAKSILARVKISVEQHGSIGIAIVGHYDCAGFPGAKEVQHRQTLNAASVIKKHFPGVPVIGLWVDENWKPWELKEQM